MSSADPVPGSTSSTPSPPAAPDRSGPRGRHAAPRGGGSRQSAAPRAERDFRPDVQGLRAIAVGLVVAYHLYPSAVPGGFVGVDVFFAISGYLITSHLLRTFQRTGRVRMLDFYGRRARRLLPAAALVLTVTWFASKHFLPATRLPAAAEQIRASALYFQNWVLAHDAVSYLTAEDAPSPVQHFWSLSVEEQFYLVWPLVFVVAALVARRRRIRLGHSSAALVAAAIVLASLAWSIRLTSTNPQAAYFVTTTRIWELGLGGLLALAPRTFARRVARHAWLAWIGLALVLGSAFGLSGGSAFPGSIALLPVGGAVLVLAAGSSAARLSPARLTATRPMVFVGDVSYSVYLWHWPLIVLWKDYSGGSIGALDGPAIAVASLVLAWLTKVFVEDPVRRASFVTAAPWRSLATAVTVAVPVLLVASYSPPAPFTGHLDNQHPGAAALAALAAPTPVASSPPTGSATPSGKREAARVPSVAQPSGPILPPLVDAAGDMPPYYGCEAGRTDTTSRLCTFGDTRHPRKTIALIGDSHAAQWISALDAIGKRRHWKLVTYLHQTCTWTTTLTTVFFQPDPYQACQDWGRSATREMVKLHPDVVITTSRPVLGLAGGPKAGAVAWARIAAGMMPYWQRMRAQHTAILAIKESPEPGRNVPDCLSNPRRTVAQCSTPASRAVKHGTPMERAVQQFGSGAALVDMNAYICAPTVCPAVIGNICVYRDNHHLTRTYTMTLVAYLDRKLMATGEF